MTATIAASQKLFEFPTPIAPSELRPLLEHIVLTPNVRVVEPFGVRVFLELPGLELSKTNEGTIVEGESFVNMRHGWFHTGYDRIPFRVHERSQRYNALQIDPYDVGSDMVAEGIINHVKTYFPK